MAQAPTTPTITATDKNMGEFAKALVDYTSSVKGSTVKYQDLQDEFYGVRKQELSEYDNYLKTLHRQNKQGDDERLAFLRRAKSSESAYRQTAVAQKQAYADQQQAVKSAKKILTEQQTAGQNTVKAQQNYAEAVLAAARAADASLAADKEYATEGPKLTKAMREQEAQLHAINWKVPFKNAGKSLADSFGRLFSAALFTKGATEVYDTLKTQIATGIGLHWTDYFAKGAQLGLQPQQYTELVAAHRQAVLAAGGLEKNFELLQEGQTRYLNLIGDTGATTTYVQEQMSMLTRSGIRPTIADVTLLDESFKALRKTSGLLPGQLQAAFSEIIEDESTIARLRAVASDDERRAIVAGTINRFKENVALGMTVEQAKAATKALNKLAGQSPLERFKQAARLRAFGGAMGIGGTEEAARILQKGKRATPEEQQRMQRVLSQRKSVV